jgi:hypothetical protein
MTTGVRSGQIGNCIESLYRHTTKNGGEGGKEQVVKHLIYNNQAKIEHQPKEDYRKNEGMTKRNNDLSRSDRGLSEE